MKSLVSGSAAFVVGLFLLAPTAVQAADVIYFNDTPNNLMAMRSGGAAGNEVADDFVISDHVTLEGGTFTGLLTGGSPISAISRVMIEIYRVFPLDSTEPATSGVPSRANSPSDRSFASAASDLSQLSFSTTLLSPTFTANNSVNKGINPLPNQSTGGEGPITGSEVQFVFSLPTAIDLDAGHYFFVPTVEFSDTSSFYFLSASQPISGAETTPLDPDLQTWVRNGSLDPNWLRVGTDIVGGSPAPMFNASFSLTGAAVTSSVPEPATWASLFLGFGIVGAAMRKPRGQLNFAFG